MYLAQILAAMLNIMHQNMLAIAFTIYIFPSCFFATEPIAKKKKNH